MTTVAYVGNFIPEHSTESHIAKALNNVGHEVVKLQESGFDWTTLKERCAGADMLLWTRTAGYDGDRQVQRANLKSLDIPSCGVHLDRWWGLRRADTEGGPADPNRSPFFDCSYVFTADGGNAEKWLEHGINHHWSPPGILSDEAKRVGVYRKDYAAEVGFVGNLRNYGHPEWGPYRRQLYRFLAHTYKGRFKLWEGGIRGQDLADLYASVKVLVGDSCLAGDGPMLPQGVRGGARLYQSDRIPETLGRGGFLVHPDVEGVTDGTLWEDGADLLTYDLGDFDHLRRQIDLALNDEGLRASIAARGRATTLARHTYEARLERVLQIVLAP